MNAVVYLVAEKICEHANATTPPAIVLEMEQVLTRLYMGKVKKHYGGLAWKDSDPRKVEKIKITGLAAIKRDFCMWVRKILKEILSILLLENNESTQVRCTKIRTLLFQSMIRLFAKQVPLADLTITVSYAGLNKYKAEAQLALALLKQHKLMTGGAMLPWGERMSYVIVEDPPLVRKNDKAMLLSLFHNQSTFYPDRPPKPLDLAFYMKQLQAPVEDLLVYHPEVGNPTSFWEVFSRQLKTCREQNHRGVPCNFELMKEYLRQCKPVEVDQLTQDQRRFKRAMERRKLQIKQARKKKKLV